MKSMFSFLICTSLIAPLATDAPAKQDRSQPTDDPIYELGKEGDSGITAPKSVYQPDPEHTDRARRKKISGTVIVSFVVTREGTVRDVKIVRSLDKELDQQALTAVNKWKFEPATKDGQQVSVRIKAETDFRIRQRDNLVVRLVVELTNYHKVPIKQCLRELLNLAMNRVGVEPGR